jgi:hypothetical protein
MKPKRKDPKDISGAKGATARIWHRQILNLGFLCFKGFKEKIGFI